MLALWGMASAAAMGLMSGLVSGSEQGQQQGANASLMALAGLLGPGLFSQTFARAIAPGAAWQLPGAPFLLAAAMLAGATVGDADGGAGPELIALVAVDQPPEHADLIPLTFA